MSLNNQQFIVRWLDIKMQPHEKLYHDYDTAVKAYKWLLASGAEAPDLAIVKRVSPPKSDTESEPDKFTIS